MCALRKNQQIKPNNLTVILLASMPDKGMKSLGNKSLLRLDAKTIIDHQIIHIQKVYKNCNIIIVCGFESKKFIKLVNAKKNISIIEHDIDEYTNFGKSLRAALSEINNSSDVIFINSNVIINSETISRLTYSQSFIIVNKNNKFESPIGCTHNDTEIEYIFYDLKHKICEFIYLTSADVGLLKSILSNETDNKYMFELINLCILKGIKLLPMVVDTDKIILYDSINKIKKIKKILTNV